MSNPYVGEVRMFAGTFAPLGWAFCDGSLLPISQNEPLFQLIGTTYGGDGITTFALPDLRGRIPFHQGSGLAIGQQGGEEAVTLTQSQTPAHSHALAVSEARGDAASPAGAVFSRDGAGAALPYSPASPDGLLAPGAIGPAGGSQPHENMPPFLCVNFVISLFGIFPSQA